MIFLTVGSQLPFDRLVTMVDTWAGNHLEHPVVAQIGDSDYHPAHLDVVPILTPSEYDRMMQDADLIISHVGMGTIINSLSLNKPMILLPRIAGLGETRNDHQTDTALKLTRFSSMKVAWNEDELVTHLNETLGTRCEPRAASIELSPSLKSAIQGFLGEVERERA